MTDYLILFAVVFGVHLLPAFGPPTWTVIVIYGLSTKMPLPALVIVGATAAALGRFALANGFRLVRGHIPQKMKHNLQAAGDAVEKHKRGSLVAIGLFALSPLPLRSCSRLRVLLGSGSSTLRPHSLLVALSRIQSTPLPRRGSRRPAWEEHLSTTSPVPSASAWRYSCSGCSWHWRK